MTSSAHTSGTQQETPARGVPRRTLWVLLIVAVAANGITSVSALPAGVGVAFGVLALVLGAMLVRDHYRRRARSAAGHAPSGQSAVGHPRPLVESGRTARELYAERDPGDAPA